MIHTSFRQQSLGLLAWLAATFAAGSVGAVASAQAASFYAQLCQPTWAPPAWLFGPVWTTLYILMAVAAWLVWRKHGFSGAATALWLFIIQLLANALWTWLFFALHLGALSFAEIVLLWLLIAATIFAFWPLQRLAALLLLPYLIWVSLATALTFSLWQLNHAVLS
jgi:tryptophan-rich sensory protein